MDQVGPDVAGQITTTPEGMPWAVAGGFGVGAGEGPPLVLLHGSGPTALLFLPLLQRLSGVRAIAVDRPGLGLSDPVQLPRKRYRDAAVEFAAPPRLERILAEHESLDIAGKGALLRREGLYASLISAWREQRDKGTLQVLAAPARFVLEVQLRGPSAVTTGAATCLEFPTPR